MVHESIRRDIENGSRSTIMRRIFGFSIFVLTFRGFCTQTGPPTFFTFELQRACFRTPCWHRWLAYFTSFDGLFVDAVDLWEFARGNNWVHSCDLFYLLSGVSILNWATVPVVLTTPGRYISRFSIDGVYMEGMFRTSIRILLSIGVMSCGTRVSMMWALNAVPA